MEYIFVYGMMTAVRDDLSHLSPLASCSHRLLFYWSSQRLLFARLLVASTGNVTGHVYCS